MISKVAMDAQNAQMADSSKLSRKKKSSVPGEGVPQMAPSMGMTSNFNSNTMSSSQQLQ